MQTFKKQDLIDSTASATGMSKVQSKIVVDTIVSTIIEALERGDSVAIQNFGSFNVKQRNARTGVNPATGQKIKIPARKTVTFKASSQLKTGVNNGGVKKKIKK
ncbi:HU family DNA-binding protein [Candidatus Deianiraea vastatrix]|uniref:DNA-binding protein HU n=1 Tax=Candidatus Deianiraea vastatrix TaxID=2163644 RepID=A0A5B8XI31_9RICK|nr:HU family DNA-binding protein [Candidatus Deianiraea vastatrix]QED23684.1 DNA-binding protein HU [Candidatus Deianiraea vastatrix]